MKLFTIHYMSNNEGENEVVKTASIQAKTTREAKAEAKKQQPTDATWFEIVNVESL